MWNVRLRKKQMLHLFSHMWKLKKNPSESRLVMTRGGQCGQTEEIGSCIPNSSGDDTPEQCQVILIHINTFTFL